MMNKRWLAGGAGLALVVVGAVAVAFASDWGGGKGGRHRGGQGGGGSVVRLMQYDTNKDGSVTRAEIDAGLEAEFRTADVNGDGRLDAAEFQKYNDAKRAERKARFEAWRAKKGADGAEPKRNFADHGTRNFDPIKNMDWNLDGFITPDEFAGRVHAQAMRADRNGDGTIAAEELKHRGRYKKGDKPDGTTPAPAPNSTPEQ